MLETGHRRHKFGQDKGEVHSTAVQREAGRGDRAAGNGNLGEVEASKPTRQGFVVMFARVLYAHGSHLNCFFLPYTEVI